MPTVGETIRRLRERRGLTQSELAKGTGLQQSYVSMLEAGEREPSLTTLTKLARVLGVNVSTLLKE